MGRKIRRKVDIAVCIDLGHRVKSSMTVICSKSLESETYACIKFHLKGARTVKSEALNWAVAASSSNYSMYIRQMGSYHGSFVMIFMSWTLCLALFLSLIEHYLH